MIFVWHEICKILELESQYLKLTVLNQNYDSLLTHFYRTNNS